MRASRCSIMINDILAIADRELQKKLSDPEYVRRMNAARLGQSPEYMLISPITHSLQDLELLSMLQGDAFHGTRVPGFPLLPVEDSLFLYGGPVAYNSGFPRHRAIIMTFDKNEDPSICDESVRNLVRHPGAQNIPIVCFSADYTNGFVEALDHEALRDLSLEAELAAKTKRPRDIDSKVLATVCSDSRVEPPPTPDGLPMAIESLGGHIPQYTGRPDETQQLNSFFEVWLEEIPQDRSVLIFAHGSFDCDGPACGAGKACMTAESVNDPILGKVIKRLAHDASALEKELPDCPEKRVESLAEATKRNLYSYPSMSKGLEAGIDMFATVLLLDTVKNTLLLPEKAKRLNL